MPWSRAKQLPEDEKSADAAKARARALEYLAGRELSSAVVYERLCRWFTAEAAAQAVAELVEQGWLDDARYARIKAQSLLAARKSRRAAARTLKEQGLREEQITAALAEFYDAQDEEEDPELAAATALVTGRYRAKLAAGRRDLVTAALARRGFSYPVIRAALAAAEEQTLA